MKRLFAACVVLILLIGGCISSSNKAEVEKFIQDAFKARAEAVFLYKDKKPLAQYFSPEALEQTREFLNWSPRGQWHNVKDLKYSITLRIRNLKIDGKQATAEVAETVVVTWDFIDPAKVSGTDFVKEDAWSNRKHVLKLILTPEGNWLVDQDIVEK